jgi:hypothetical protein
MYPFRHTKEPPIAAEAVPGHCSWPEAVLSSRAKKKTGIQIPGLFSINPEGDIISSSVGFEFKLHLL